MTRWYYTDPLAAAWMAKHFGMRFETSYRSPRSDDMRSEERLPSILKMAMEKKPFLDHWFQGLLIHPDSLHLLESRKGDLIRWHNPAAHDANLHRIEVVINDLPMHPSNRLLEIIQRNGIHFMWPEREAA